MIAEVRAVRAEVELALEGNAMPGLGDATAQRAHLLDQWIRQARGRRQLVCLACAAEHGMIQQHHLELVRQTALKTTDRALRALYWASVKRWSRMPVFGRGSTTGPVPARGAPGATSRQLCERCDALRHDVRRFSPHARLQQDGFDSEPTERSQTASWYRCGACHTRWVRRVPPSEHFAVWSVVSCVPFDAALPTHQLVPLKR